MKTKNHGLIVWAVVLFMATAWERVSAVEGEGWWKNIEIGTRATWVYLTDHQRDINAVGASEGSFYGSINQLNPVQNNWPLKPFMAYKFCPHTGLELAWDSFSARTITRSDGHTDGDLNLMGPMLSYFIRYPNATGLTPYAGVGVVYYHVDFDEDASWHYPRGSFTQLMDFDHTYGLLGYGGLMWKFAEQWSAELYIRYTKVDAEGVHWQGFNDGGNPLSPSGDVSFPLSNIAAGLGVRYSF